MNLCKQLITIILDPPAEFDLTHYDNAKNWYERASILKSFIQRFTPWHQSFMKNFDSSLTTIQEHIDLLEKRSRTKSICHAYQWSLESQNQSSEEKIDEIDSITALEIQPTNINKRRLNP